MKNRFKHDLALNQNTLEYAAYCILVLSSNTLEYQTVWFKPQFYFWVLFWIYTFIWKIRYFRYTVDLKIQGQRYYQRQCRIDLFSCFCSFFPWSTTDRSSRLYGNIIRNEWFINIKFKIWKWSQLAFINRISK